VTQAGVCPGGGDRADLQRACGELFAVLHEDVELGAIGRELLEVEHSLEGLLNLLDVLADHHLGLEAPLEPLGAGDVVGVRVRLEHVVHAQLLVAQKHRELLERVGLRLGPERVVVEDRIDHDGVLRARIEDDVGQRVGRGIEEGLDVHGGSRPGWVSSWPLHAAYQPLVRGGALLSAVLRGP
jgi:hypothetical protein